MNAVERLRRDHTILRAKLCVLESALRMGPDAWYVLREVCFTLARLEQAIGVCGGARHKPDYEPAAALGIDA